MPDMTIFTNVRSFTGTDECTYYIWSPLMHRSVLCNTYAATSYYVCCEFLWEIVYLHIIVRKR
jgi:hypothetical protein